MAGLHAAGAQSQNQRVGAGSDSHAVSYFTKRGNFFLQRCSFAAQHELLRSKHAFDGRANLGANRRVLGGKVELRNRFESRICL